MRTSLIVVALALAGCAKGTFVTLSLDQAMSAPATAGIDLALSLGGRPASVSLHGPFAFSTSTSLQIGSGSGSLTVTATARDSGGAAIDSATDSVNVVTGKTASLSLTLGGVAIPDLSQAISGDLAGADLAGVDLSGADLTTVPAAPGAPTSVVASGGNAQATVTWDAPASSGTSAITGYTVTSSPDNLVVTATTTMATITGLTNGTPYTFSVTATNAAGTGPAGVSNTTTPTATPMAPSAPTNVTAVANVDHGATVSWTASDNHGSPLQGYAIAATQIAGTLGTAGPTATSAQVTGLTPGSHVYLTVTATNGIGTSVASFPSSAITAATLADAPTGVTADINGVPDGANVSWTASAADGFSAITSYKVIASPGGASVTTARPAPPPAPRSPASPRAPLHLQGARYQPRR